MTPQVVSRARRSKGCHDHTEDPSNVNGQASTKKRVTLVLPELLDHQLEMYCVGVGRLKNEVVATALTQYLDTTLNRVQKEALQVFRKAAAAGTH